MLKFGKRGTTNWIFFSMWDCMDQCYLKKCDFCFQIELHRPIFTHFEKREPIIGWVHYALASLNYCRIQSILYPSSICLRNVLWPWWYNLGHVMIIGSSILIGWMQNTNTAIGIGPVHNFSSIEHCGLHLGEMTLYQGHIIHFDHWQLSYKSFWHNFM